MGKAGDADRRELLRQCCVMGAGLLRGLPKLVRVLDEMQGGFGSTAYGRMTSRSTGSPTMTAALNTDPARTAMNRVDAIIRSVHTELSELVRIHAKWTTTSKGKPTGEGEPGCEILERHGAWEPVLVEASDVGGTLDRKYRLGRWAYDHVVRYGRLPNGAEINTHLRGGIVRVKA